MMGKNVEIASTENSVSGYLRVHGTRFWNIGGRTITEIIDQSYNENREDEE